MAPAPETDAQPLTEPADYRALITLAEPSQPCSETLPRADVQRATFSLAKVAVTIVASVVGTLASLILILSGLYQLIPDRLPSLDLPPETLGATLHDVTLEEINADGDIRKIRIAYTVEFSGFNERRHAYGSYAVFRYSLKTVDGESWVSLERDPWYMTETGDGAPSWSSAFATFGFEANKSDRFNDKLEITKGREGSCVFVRVYIYDAKPKDIRTVVPEASTTPQSYAFDVDQLRQNHRLAYADTKPFNTHENVPACEELGIATA